MCCCASVSQQTPYSNKLFTPHQRRLPPAEQHRSALSRPFFHFPTLLSMLSFTPHVLILSVLYPISCIEPLNLSVLYTNKPSSFYVSFISLFYPFLFLLNLIFISIYFQAALIIKLGSPDVSNVVIVFFNVSGTHKQMLWCWHSYKFKKLAHAKEENLDMHQMLDQTLMELNNM
ncbi:unnamed protein product [Oncorhynchus mykiss]|uniref:Uncharacterized protein n=1 Tax=Oncorhynchus mykiss TaxID=8022 RepID=A0A060WFG7_ONCMY|nr:unnamed protein product [Oncorhynchus mykiss]